MAVTIGINEVAEVVLCGRWTSGWETRMVFHYKNVYLVAAEMDQSDVQAWATGLNDAIKAYVAGSHEWYQVIVTNITDWAQETFAFDPLLPGTSPGDVLPYQMAGLCVGYTATKRRQAKKYLPGIVEGAQNAGLLLGAAELALQAWADEWNTTFSTGVGTGLEAVVWSRTDLAAYRITNAVARPIMSTQRRRKQGIGI